MKELRCLGGPLEAGDDDNLELVTDHRLPPVAVHYRKVRINGGDGEHVDCWVADGMTFENAIARLKDIEPLD